MVRLAWVPILMANPQQQLKPTKKKIWLMTIQPKMESSLTDLSLISVQQQDNQDGWCQWQLRQPADEWIHESHFWMVLTEMLFNYICGKVKN